MIIFYTSRSLILRYLIFNYSRLFIFATDVALFKNFVNIHLRKYAVVAILILRFPTHNHISEKLILSDRKITKFNLIDKIPESVVNPFKVTYSQEFKICPFIFIFYLFSAVL